MRLDSIFEYNKMKKILTIVYDLDKGGTQRAAQIFAETYRDMGHDSRLLSLYGLGLRYNEIRNNIKVWHRISDDNLNEMKQWSPDIIHIHSHGPKEEDINRVLDALQTQDVKVIEQNVFSTPSPWASRIDVSFQFSNWALWLYNIRGGNIAKATIVPNPVNCNNFYPKGPVEVKEFRDKYNIPKDAFVIGRVGQSSAGKWSVVLVDCFNRLAKKYENLYMVIINPPSNILEEVSRSLFKNRIIHIQNIYGDDALSTAYSSFDLMVHIADMGESFGYVLAESILCGTPVVTLSTPWGDNSQCEVVGNLKGGYVVNSSNGVIKAVEHYISSPDKYVLKKLGHEHICHNYNCIKVANEAINGLIYSGDDIKNGVILRSRIDAILKNTFERTSMLTILLIRTNNLFFRRLTAYNYPMKILLPKVLKKIFHLNIINVL